MLAFCITSWYGNCTLESKNKLSKIVRNAKKLGVCNAKDLVTIYELNVLKQCKTIISDQTHPLNNNYVSLRSGKRLRSMFARTVRYKESFIPASIRLINCNDNYTKIIQ